ncbi:F0F1 ATP synthase subunit delta [Microbacterium imperiale]|uniref:ATP synthase subunit delta n=1 Tax=Microbacterium imperiale TaxID=33884 RepID=A0A9W6M292_9MICO|nr:F0F1 ATP synthase subunit delta [Microbacterium imperiale]MBP2420111.1 F-type H+-transporting ATPase subunit delta [Microbacterium imperiale]MDS0198026.1 F0F1 ATP synthase subunit delta [Microbacterium imperiale]BFE40452.1 F0F1 ATP synthase subunit delta [Microbacterium imperiale]GLJ78572.1 ATP synthase subunit delta [Microbacterium imperiale]
MGSATTQALVATTSAIGAASGLTLDVAGELFVAARALADSPQLSGALTDDTASLQARDAVVTQVFGSVFAPQTVALLQVAAEQRWSSVDDFVDAVEELAIRVAAVADTGDLENELFGVLHAIAGNPELELALGSRLGDASAKGALVDRLLDGRAGAGARLVASAVVQRPRERRVRQLLERAIRIVSSQRGRIVATVRTAAPLNDHQRARLTDTLSRRYGTAVALNLIVDPAVVGGLRIEIGDDVIDATVASRLSDLRQRLAG